MLEIAFSAQRSVVKASPYFLRESWRFLMLTPLFLGWDTETHKHEMTFPKIMHSSPLHCTPPTWRWVPSGISCILMTSAFMLCKFHYLTMLGRFPVFKWIWWNAWAFMLTPTQSPSKAPVFAHNKDCSSGSTAFKWHSFCPQFSSHPSGIAFLWH